MRLPSWVLAAVVAFVAVRPAAAQNAPLAPTSGPPSAAGSVEPIPNVFGAPVMGAPIRPSDRDPPHQTFSPSLGVVGVPIEPSSPASSANGSGFGVKRAALGAPESAGSPITANAVEGVARTAYTPPTDDPVNDVLLRRSGRPDDARTFEHNVPSVPMVHTSDKFGDKISDALGGSLGNRTDWFKSDHVFDGFISPVTNPFLFEDPRSLTEVRPIFMYQKIPGANPDFQGGNIWFYGTQGRVAFTDRLSFVFNKLGGITISPSGSSQFSSETGFAELWLGPKYTIIRNEECCSLLAGGLQFQIPAGSPSTSQNTGTLSLVPYLSYAQNFLRDLSIGGFNGMVSTGYSASVNNKRSDYYYLSGHLDLDVMNCHHFYPLMEMNWLLYTTNGQTTPIGVEGRDLFNFGGQAKGQGMLTLAFGARYKISEAAQIGAAFEFPLAGPKDIFQYRFTVDFILRY